MTATSIYPVLLTTEVAATANFYRTTFGFTPTFESDWYISLTLDGNELAVLDAHHSTIPEPQRGTPTTGLIINIEVADVDTLYERMLAAGQHTIVQPLRSEKFGQRHFIVHAPDGILIDVITPIEFDAEFVAEISAT